jgi:hypothetical protein
MKKPATQTKELEMKSKPRHPQDDRIAKVVSRHWLTIPDDLERTKAVAKEALKALATGILTTKL